MANLADKLKQAANNAAVDDATTTKVPTHGPIQDVRVSDPVIGPRAIAVPVRVIMKDGAEHCYEYRTDTKGEHGKLWPVQC